MIKSKASFNCINKYSLKAVQLNTTHPHPNNWRLMCLESLIWKWSCRPIAGFQVTYPATTHLLQTVNNPVLHLILTLAASIILQTCLAVISTHILHGINLLAFNNLTNSTNLYKSSHTNTCTWIWLPLGEGTLESFCFKVQLIPHQHLGVLH